MSLTRWSDECVIESQRDADPALTPYAVGEHHMTGGPVLRGPWGMISLLDSSENWSSLREECKRLNAAFAHGLLTACRKICEIGGSCLVEGDRCSRCRGVV